MKLLKHKSKLTHKNNNLFNHRNKQLHNKSLLTKRKWKLMQKLRKNTDLQVFLMAMLAC
ncbi:Uncharacterised protein [Mycobacteroides abscessus]|nr:Uncharacterised protein [Mycobacteroides abscessus]